MTNNRTSQSRRRFLASVAATTILNGCQSGREPDSKQTTSAVTSTRPTQTVETASDWTTTTVQPEFTLTTDTSSKADTKELDVAGSLAHADGIDTLQVHLETGAERHLTFSGTERAKYAVSFTVNGGQRYGGKVSYRTESGKEYETRFVTEYVPQEAVFSNQSPLVGAHYYPWYGPGRHWDSHIETPALGEYSARNPEVISQHVEWATTHGIDFFSMSWWGQGSWEDVTIKDYVLPTVPATEVDFHILYEPFGTLDGEPGSIDLDNPSNRRQLVEDFAYLDRTYFGRENYLQIDDKPVVFMYTTGSFHGDIESALAAVRDTVSEGVYLIADFVDWRRPPLPRHRQLMRSFDAVSSYNMYKPYEDINRNFAQRMARFYPSWLLAAKESDVDFLPMVTPGFNNTDVPDTDKPVLKRSFSQFETVCELTKQYLDPRLDAVYVTSFNEWHENTQIEPGGEYGTTYLDVVKNQFDKRPNHAIANFVQLEIEFNKTVAESEVNSNVSPENARELAFALFEIELFIDGKSIETYSVGDVKDEPEFTQGAYDPVSHANRTQRWTGGPTGRLSMYFDEKLLDATELRIRGVPVKDGLSGTVFIEGMPVGKLSFGTRRYKEYEVSLKIADQPSSKNQQSRSAWYPRHQTGAGD
ncbi:glycoside hydrolase family 99-like domain-containing protein [Halorussus sp. MSC15.2]|uniref:glycoside hydrolase family 99-like domain-containing protein n=1 Tax=Halorussus sp. MSC15.2 TaxID=2283638 RepID=UPI0013D45305|nr:glycoside hydrolase family 99-like domain-containing protein [Halorussus sp. MSC15.2]NEU58612.1 hypothetical protein [Halorussus sp. MSC15.2]